MITRVVLGRVGINLAPALRKEEEEGLCMNLRRGLRRRVRIRRRRIVRRRLLLRGGDDIYTTPRHHDASMTPGRFINIYNSRPTLFETRAAKPAVLDYLPIPPPSPSSKPPRSCEAAFFLRRHDHLQSIYIPYFIPSNLIRLCTYLLLACVQAIWCFIFVFTGWVFVFLRVCHGRSLEVGAGVSTFYYSPFQ